MKWFGITQARTLVKRELGISAAALKKTPGMNGNTQYPWYSMESGNLLIEVYTNAYLDGKLIVLHLTFGDGLGSIDRYFYADTLEEVPEYTEKQRWLDIYFLVEDKSREQIEAMVNRHEKAFSKAYLEHQNSV